MSEETKTFKLPNRKVKVVPVRRKGAWLEPTHEAAFTFGKASKKYAAPLVGKNRVARVLTEEEQKYFEEVLDRDLNPFKKMEDNYWVTRFVTLDKNIKVLDLSDPDDYISWKILKLQKDTIVEGGENRFSKGTYKFFIDDLDYEDKSRSKSATARKDAYKFFGKITDKGRTAMVDFLTVYYQNKPGKRVPDGANPDWLEAELDKIIENDIDGFLLVSNDPEYDTKLFITKAIRSKAIVKVNGAYQLPDGEIIADTLSTLIVCLKDEVNSESYMQIKARIEA